MPQTPAWAIPYPDLPKRPPDIPVDLQLMADRIDKLPFDEKIPATTARAYVWIDTGGGTSQWKPLPEVWKYDENTKNWDMQWYGPHEPRFSALTFTPPHPNLGDQVAVSGTIVDQMNVPITEGTVVLMREDILRSGGTEVARAPLGAMGEYTLTDPGIAIIGQVIYHVEYIAPDIRYEDGHSQEISFDVGVPKVTGLAYTTFTATSVEFTWDPVAGADGYEVYENGSLIATVARTDSGAIAINPGDVPKFKVRAFKNDLAGNPVYGPFSDELYRVDTAVTVTTQPVNANAGDSYTIAGTVANISGGPIQVGQVEIQHRQTASGPWRAGPSVNVVNGAWTYSSTYQHVGNGLQFHLIYHPPALSPERGSETTSNQVNIGLRTVGTLSTGSSSHTSCSISWAKVPSATRYQIGNGTTVIPGGTLGNVSSKTISLSQNTNYAWRVRAGEQDENGTWIYGGWSPILNFNGGRPEKRDASNKTVRVNCSNSGTVRVGEGWSTSKFVRQGRWDTSGGYYYGIYDYGSVKNAVRSSIGTANYDSGNPKVMSGYTKLYRRGDVGRRVTATIGLIASASAAGVGGRPNLQGTATHTNMNYNQWKQIGLNTDLLTRLMKGQARSLAVARDNTTDYSALNRHTAGSEDGDLWIRVSWNRLVQSKINPRWWR